MINAVLINRLLSLLPNFLYPVKLLIIKKLFRSFGRNSKVPHDAYYGTFKNIDIGDNVFINRGFFCSVKVSLIIEDRVMFGGNCSIIGGDHFFAEPSENMRFTNLLGENKGLVIEADAWIGHGTTILKNGNIGEGAIIGSHSLVTKPIKPYSVNVGHPAKFLYPRFKTFEDLCRYLDMMEEKYFFKSKHSKESLKALLYDRATK